MLSTLPKLADKSFILGFLLPSILFFVGIYFVLVDVKWVQETAKAAMNKEALETFVWGAVAAWLFAISLSIVNHLLLQILEGYKPPFSVIPLLRARQQCDFDRLLHSISAHEKAWADEGDKYPEELRASYRRLLIRRATRFPSARTLVLPTTFGNAVRAFEDYSRTIYGADAIPLWSHLSSVINKDFAEELQDARTEVNSLVNIVFLAFIVAVMALSRVVYDLPWGTTVSLLWLQGVELYFLFLTAAAFFVCFGAYLLAIERAVAWGAVVKAAFDCFLPSLATQLGYQLPKTGNARRNFWTEVSRQSIYHDPMSVDRWKKTPSAAKEKEEESGAEQDEDEDKDD